MKFITNLKNKLTRATMVLLLALLTTTTWAQLVQDTDGYYLIGSVQNWDDFAELVNNGTNPAANAKMTADIDLGDDQTYISPTWHGDFSEQHYHGTFDGQGHTLTVHYNSSNLFHTPFSQTSGATIKNLHVAGTITSTWSGAASHISGLISNSAGSDVIQNVWVSVDITGGSGERLDWGAFVGCNNCGNTTITDCLFTGSITNTGTRNGCFVGLLYTGSITTTNCLSTGTFNFDSSTSTVSVGTMTNCYVKTHPASIPSSMQVTDARLANGTIATALQAGRTEEVWVQDPVTNQPVLKIFASLTQDENGYYLLGSVQDWKNFAELVNTTPTANAKMTADINLGDDQTMIGATGANETSPCFQGIFDGQGHTLTVAYTSIGNESVGAPFAKINGATIKNLHVAGTINSGGYHPSVVSDSWGTSTVENVWSSLTIISTRSGWVECGSIVGCMKAGNLTIKDCLFTGSISASGGYNGCFVGYNYQGTTTMTNCLSLGTFSYPNGYNSWTSGPAGTHTNCFVKQFQNNDIPTAMQITDEQLADGTVAYKLQASRTDMVWGQRIGTDPEPVLTNDENYRVYRSINGGYTNDQTLAYEGLQQDADDNYLIGSVWDWQDFAALVNGGTTTANAKMTADINLGDDQTVIGATTVSTDAYSLGLGYHYKGVFDGQGHTLTVAYNATDNNSASPFSSIEGATIKNMHIAGSMVSPKACGAGVASATGGTGNVIQNVWVSATIIGNGQDWNCSASIVGCVKNGSVTISDCLFTGSVTSVFHHNGCFVGYIDSGSASIDNSLSTGTFSYGGCAWQGTHNYCYVKEFPATYPAGVTQPTDAELTNGTTTTALNNGRTGDDALWVQDPITNQPMLKLFASSIRFINDGNWDVADNWNTGAMPAEGSDVTIAAAATIPSGYTANAGNLTIDLEGTLTIADGGQLIHSNNGVTATVQKSIAKATNWGVGDYTPDGWHFIASPADNAPLTNAITGNYDLYLLDYANNKWLNQKNTANASLFADGFQRGMGYLYATNDDDVTLQFAGEIIPYSSTHEITLAAGWNLVGNPFTRNVVPDMDYLTLNNAASTTSVLAGQGVVTPGMGIAVYSENGGTLAFSLPNESQSAPNNSYLQIAVEQSTMTRGGKSAITLDNAIVSFGEGDRLPKFDLLEGNAKLYIPQGGNDYAIVSAEAQGEVPVSFVAKQAGSYTLTVNPENVEMAYLHLIDNMTGADVDLLANPSYTFTASMSDYPSRFRLVFSANDENGASTGSGSFAFIDASGNIIITDGASTGSATYTLQVIDVMGHVVLSCTVVAHSVSTSGMAPGVYVLRLIDGENVKTQKIVVR